MKKVFFLILLLVLLLPSAAMAIEYNYRDDGMLSVGSKVWSGYEVPIFEFPKLSSIEEKNGKTYVTQTFKDFLVKDETGSVVYFYTVPKNTVFNDIKVIGDGEKLIEIQQCKISDHQRNNFEISFKVEDNKSVTVSFSFFNSEKIVNKTENNVDMPDLESEPDQESCQKSEVSVEFKIVVFFTIFIFLCILSKLRDYFEKKAHFEN